MPNTIEITSSLIKMSGIFSYDPKKDKNKFLQAGFKHMDVVVLPKGMPAVEKVDKIKASKTYQKNTFYKEYRAIMLADKEGLENDRSEKRGVISYLREQNFKLAFREKETEFRFESQMQEIYLFPDGTGIFSIQISPEHQNINAISELIFKARDFSSELYFETTLFEFHAWISKYVLGGISITGPKIITDEYSGSKFKVYTVIDLKLEIPDEELNHLLYEIGTSSKPGTIAEGGYSAPSKEYYSEIEDQSMFSAFKNYKMLALLDSFTVIGWNNYNSLENNFLKFNTWNKSYFNLYALNLYIRFSLYRFNSCFVDDPIKFRDEFEDFMNHFNLKHISFNFLPNLIFNKMRIAMAVDEEVVYFRTRLDSLANKIQEGQEKKQAILLTIISALSGLGAAKDILEILNRTQTHLQWSDTRFYLSISSILLIFIGILVYFLFPLTIKKIGRKFRKSIAKILPV